MVFHRNQGGQRTKFGNFPSENACWEALGRKIDVLQRTATYGGCSFTRPATWAIMLLSSKGELWVNTVYPSREACEEDRPRAALEARKANPSYGFATVIGGEEGQCIPIPPETRSLTLIHADGQLQLMGSYPNEAACENDLRIIQNGNHSLSNGHCTPVGHPPAPKGSWNPSRPSLPELVEAACPSPSPTTTQDWEKKHAALVAVCAGAQMNCGNLSRENVGCYEGNYRVLPPACETALIELGCITQGLAVAAKQEAEYEAKGVGHPDCTPDQITISNRTQNGNAHQKWNATCNGKVYLCSGQSRGAYSCVPLAK